MEPECSLTYSQKRPTCLYLGHMNQFIPIPDYLSRIHFNITLTSNTRSSNWRRSHLFPHHNPVQLSLSSTCQRGLFSFFCYQRRSAKGGAPRGEIYSLLLLSSVTYCPLGPYISLLNTPSICFFLTVRDQVSHPGQTKIKITVFFTLPFICCIADCQTERRAMTDCSQSHYSKCC
jgi:hypothetical protein